ncbi:MAG: hypothetical protein ACOCM4_13010 [Acetivibrio ethanolgignens]
MSEKKRVACFFTGGYTELTAMKTFLKKINSKVDFIQLCPVKERTSKLQIKQRTKHTGAMAKKHSGLTGEALIKYVTDFVKTERFKNESYDAILIEDDKDERFLEELPDGKGKLNLNEWTMFKDSVGKKIHEVLPDIRVIFFFAAPEVEAWFLADWENSFAKIYKDELKTQKNDKFNVVFRKYINENILTKRYRKNIEEYGYFDGEYRKISYEIQKALGASEVWRSMNVTEPIEIHYSKKLQGSEMLEEIEPKKVLKYCNQFFKEGYNALNEYE